MILNQILLEQAVRLTRKQIAAEKLGANMRKRERNAVAKAHEQLLTNPYIDFKNDELLIMSEPSGEQTERKFYLTGKKSCRQIEPGNHLCPAFWDGFPCWHRAGFEILKITSRSRRNAQFDAAVSLASSTKNSENAVISFFVKIVARPASNARFQQSAHTSLNSPSITAGLSSRASFSIWQSQHFINLLSSFGVSSRTKQFQCRIVHEKCSRTARFVHAVNSYKRNANYKNHRQSKVNPFCNCFYRSLNAAQYLWHADCN